MPQPETRVGQIGAFRERLVIAPQRRLVTGVLVALFTPGVVLSLVALVRNSASWGAATCATLFGGAIALLLHREWASPHTIDVFEAGIAFRRRGADELVPFSELFITRERAYVDIATLRPVAVRFGIGVSRGAPVWVQQYRGNRAAIARLIELIPQRVGSVPLASVELLLRRLWYSAVHQVSGATAFLVCAAIAASYAWWRVDRDEKSEAVIPTVCAIAFLGTAIDFGRRARHLLFGRRSRLYRELMVAPDGIAWAYIAGATGPLSSEVDDSHLQHTVNFHFHDGD